MEARTPVAKSRGRDARALARFLFGLVFGVLLPLLVIAAGVFGAMKLLKTSPRAERQRGSGGGQQARLVEAMPVERGDFRIRVEAMGTVQPARELMLRPQVGGEIVELHEELETGGLIAKGETVARIEPSDYELAVAEAEAALAQAKSDLALEMGRQELAREEYGLLGDQLPEGEAELLLRAPQLAKARAAIASAETRLKTARLQLERTRVTAPFNALVLEEDTELGAVVGSQGSLARLVGTDRYWVALEVPADQLRWIQLPPPGSNAAGSPVLLRDEAAWEADAAREGRVLRLSGELDPTSRLTRLLVAVEDPLALDAKNDGQPRLLLNTYLRADIQGRLIEDIVVLPRQYLRGGSEVWVMGADDLLEIREPEVLWRGEDVVLIASGLEAGERVVTSDLSAPVPGMKLRTAGGKAPRDYAPGALAEDAPSTRPLPAAARAAATTEGGA